MNRPRVSHARIALLLLTVAAGSGCTRPDAARGEPSVDEFGPSIAFVRAEKPAMSSQVLRLGNAALAGVRRFRLIDSGVVLLKNDGTISLYRTGYAESRFSIRVGADRGGLITDIRVTTDGVIVALDSRNAQLFRVSATGEVEQGVSVRSLGQFTTFSIDHLNELHALTVDTLLPLIHFKTDGSLVDRRPLPNGDFSRLPPLSRQGYVAMSRPGVLLVAFSLASKALMVFPNHQLTTIEFPEIIPFPGSTTVRDSGGIRTTLSRTRSATRALAMNNASFAVVPADPQSEIGKALVDTFDAATGAYLGSWSFPAAVVDIDAFNGKFVVLLSSGEIWTL